jgi:threonine aldolase
MIVDLRSDTVTRPSKAMREAMMNAELGDDVFGEDPTVNKLEARGAELFSKEAAMYCPSGTMTNQIAVKTYTQPGDEVIIEKTNHVYYYEGGGIAFHSGASIRTIAGTNGKINPDDVLSNINPDNLHHPITRLVCIENTSNRGGGSFYRCSEMKAISDACHNNHLKLHLDGARVFNAFTETKDDSKDVGKLFDSISFCLSKGLGCPVGSLLVGSKEFIAKARRYRKVFGGGMRQAGFLAAAGLYALDNNIVRLKDDHRRAKAIGEAVKSKSFVEKNFDVPTNIVIFKLKPEMNANDFVNHLDKNNIKCFSIGDNKIRMVTHLDFTDEMLEKTIEIISAL